MESERQTYQLHNILTWGPDAALIGEIHRCGLKFTTPQIESIPRTFGYASLCGDER